MFKVSKIKLQTIDFNDINHDFKKYWGFDLGVAQMRLGANVTKAPIGFIKNNMPLFLKMMRQDLHFSEKLTIYNDYV